MVFLLDGQSSVGDPEEAVVDHCRSVILRHSARGGLLSPSAATEDKRQDAEEMT